ncbi:Wadjet anti-phage system protein JetD domain-containing protein [Selenomonas felix]|uniref:Wadjet anti-phage system protein JetD domain-containing protein n=1 Tax=Selenomonas felix TaxID=1944634 RepID=UPI000C8216B1|nr:Wadjet anti-phage system protein JetD domain-containing protein [Selenomonas felix]
MELMPLQMHYEDIILTTLLEKYENSKAAVGELGRRPQFRILKSALSADYTDEMDVDKREAIHAAACELERQRLILVVWERHGAGRIERILLSANVSTLYQRMGKVMPLIRVNEYQTKLLALANVRTPWVQNFYATMMESLADNVIPAILPKEQVLYANLIRAILALPAEGESAIPRRVFSQRIFRNSKYFEQHIELPLLRLLRRFVDEPCASAAEYMDAAGIAVTQGKVWIAGNLTFLLGDRRYFLADFPGGLMLTYDTITAMKIDVLPPEILTIENLTNAETLTRMVDTNHLLIYTAGFPNRTVQALLLKIAPLHRTFHIRHWGDIDYGGIRIFEFLRRRYFPTLSQYRMDVETFRAYLPFAQSLTPAQRKPLLGLLEQKDFSTWHSLIRVMLDEGKWVEQEVMLWQDSSGMDSLNEE